MAKQSIDEESENRPDSLTTFESRLVNLLGLFLVQERKQSEQVSLLSRAGFRPTEIAALLGTTRNTVSVLLYQQKRGNQKSIRPKKRS